MLNRIVRYLGRSRLVNEVFGSVVFETPAITGQFRHSRFQLRIKQSVCKTSYVISLKMKPDAYAGAESNPNNFINFDIAKAEQIRSDLDACIAELRRLTARPGSSAA